MATARQIAEWIVGYRANQLGVPIDPMSLEKHLAYAQAFSLVLFCAPIFPEEIEAWRLGPVVPSVYQQFRDFGSGPILVPEDAPGPTLADSIEGFLIELIKFFGGYTAMELSNATHLEDPWRHARRGLRRHENSTNIIPKEHLKTYYAGLICDGEEALSKHELLTTVPEPRWASYYVAGICHRLMASHPFYDWELANVLLRPIKREDVPGEIYNPPEGHDYVDLGDISQLTTQEIVDRARRISRESSHRRGNLAQIEPL